MIELNSFYGMDEDKPQRKQCVQNYFTGIRRSKHQFFRINQPKTKSYMKKFRSKNR